MTCSCRLRFMVTLATCSIDNLRHVLPPRSSSNHPSPCLPLHHRTTPTQPISQRLEAKRAHATNGELTHDGQRRVRRRLVRVPRARRPGGQPGTCRQPRELFRFHCGSKRHETGEAAPPQHSSLCLTFLPPPLACAALSRRCAVCARLSRAVPIDRLLCLRGFARS